jgi:hypothetical protein
MVYFGGVGELCRVLPMWQNSRIEIGLSIVTIPFPILHGSGVYRVVVLVGIEQNLTSILCDPKGES